MVRIAIRYGLEGSVFESQEFEKISFFSKTVHSGSAAHSSFCLTSTAVFLGDKSSVE